MSFLFGSKGGKYSVGNFSSSADPMLDLFLREQNDTTSANRASDYASGKMSLDDLLGIRDLTSGARSAITSDPFAAQKLASEQVQRDPILGQLFGKGASFEKAAAEEANLRDRGYTLQPEDYEAYGQASDQIARMFGQAENSLAQSLANRGLAGAGGGAAMSQFSGLMGNKNEQLANQQRQIAQQRMQMNLDRLNSTRSYLNNMGQLGAQQANTIRQANQAGIQSRLDNLMNKRQQDIGLYGTIESARQAQAKLDQPKAGLFQSLEAGLNKGVANIGEGLFSGPTGAVKGWSESLFKKSEPDYSKTPSGFVGPLPGAGR